MSTPPFSSEPPIARESSGCLATLSLTALLIAGVVILYSFFLTPLTLFVQGMRYNAVEATITDSRVDWKSEDGKVEREEPDANKPLFKPLVRYQYRIGGTSYRASRIGFGVPDATTKAEAQAAASQYPEGSKQTAYVHPDKPDYSVLDRGFRPALLLGLIPLAMVVIGGTGLLRRLTRAVAGPPAYGDAPAMPSTGKDLERGTPITRRGKAGWGALIVVVIFGAFWNFVVSFLVREVARSWKDGAPGCHGWFLTFFAIPFVVVGLVMIGVFFYCLLKLFNPRPILALSSGAVGLGESFEAAWRFTGRYDRIHRLRLMFEGREEATYRRGTSTATDREVFLSIDLIDTTNPAEIRFGKTTVTVPAGAVPSFDGQHNKIVYVIRVIGDIKRWPDVNEEFVVRILHAPAVQPAAAVEGGAT